MRAIGFYSSAIESLEYLSEEQIKMYDAYNQGLNDYIANVCFFGWDEHTTARMLPPEFYIFGMTGDALEPFKTEDILANGRLISFHLSWNWNQDLAREAIRQSHPDLADIVEELIPFSSEFLSALVTVVDDDDLMEWN